jgi:segregation and condensation protein B
LEVKPLFADQVARVIPEWAPKPLTKQALETLVIVALKQPVTIGDINAIRKIESAGTVHTLRNRKLIARAARLGPNREKFWRTTPLFLEMFNLKSLDELRQDGRAEEVFPEIFGTGEVIAEDDALDQTEGQQANNSGEEALDGDDESEKSETAGAEHFGVVVGQGLRCGLGVFDFGAEDSAHVDIGG